MDYGTFRSVTYFDPLQGLMFTVSVSDSLDAVASQAGMIRVTATNIDDQDFDAPTVIAIQEFNISRVGEVDNGDEGTLREITYLNKGGGNNIIQVTDTLDSIQQQTVAAGGVIPSLAIISPPAGTYVANSVTITLSSNASGASIYYTIDGSTPTTSSTLYTAPFTIDINRTVRAIAVLTGLPQGGVTSAAINVKCFTPVANPIGGLINSSTPITLTTATTGGTIRFTTNGADPTSSDTIYTTPLFFSGATTLKSRTFKTNQVDSDVRTSGFTVFVEIMLVGDVSNTAGVDGRLYRSFNLGTTWNEMQPLGNTDVRWQQTSAQVGGGFLLAGTADSNRIFFSTDNGANWTEKFSPNDNTFNGNFVRSVSGQNVIAFGQNINSAQPNIFLSTDYGDTWSPLTVDGFDTSSPNGWNASIEGNTIITNRIVTISPADTEVRISKDLGATWFTPTGAPVVSERTIQSNAYISSDENIIILGTSTTSDGNRQIAMSTNGGTSFSSISSPISGQNYFICGATDGSRIFLARSSAVSDNNTFWYSDNLGQTWVSVNPRAITSSNAWVTFACSQDGRVVMVGDNNELFVSTNYGASFSKVGPTGTISNNRQWRGATVKVNPVYKVSDPFFTPQSTSIPSGTNIEITTVTTGDEIRYTTDGSAPTISSTLYTGPIQVNSNTNFRARAFKSGSVDSNIVNQNYTTT